MGGPSSHADVAAELATRPGHTNLRSTLVRWLLITVSLTFLGALLAAPLAAVFAMALDQGWHAYFSSFSDEATRASIRLTLTTAAIVRRMEARVASSLKLEK